MVKESTLDRGVMIIFIITSLILALFTIIYFATDWLALGYSGPPDNKNTIKITELYDGRTVTNTTKSASV